MRDFEAAAAEAQHQKKPLLAASSLPGPAGTAILSDPPLGSQTAPAHLQNRLLARALAGILITFAAMAACSFAAAYAVVVCVPGGSWWLLIAVWVAVEATFKWWFARYHVPKFERQPQPHAPKSLDPLLHFKRVLAHARFHKACGHNVDWNSYLSKWFLGAHPEDICLGNLLEMLGYGFYYQTKQGLKETGKWRELQGLVSHFLSTSGMPIKHGYNPDLRFMAHLWQPLRWTHRPLLFYMMTEAIAFATGVGMQAMGYQKGRSTSGMVFYFHPGNPLHKAGLQNQQQAPPLLMLHGVGLGLLPYMLVISQLTACGLPVLCPEAKHASMRLCSYIPTACEVAENVVSILDQLGLGQASIIAHSYGTFVASRLVQAHRQRAVHSLSLIDPVCFGMFLPGLLHNFIYRTPLDVFKQHGLVAAAKASFVWLVSRDVHCAATFCRRFFWTDVNLWAEDLPEKCLIVLAGQDELLHAEEIRQIATQGYKGLKRPENVTPSLNAQSLHLHHQQQLQQQPLQAMRPPMPRPPMPRPPRKPTPSVTHVVPSSNTSSSQSSRRSMSSSPIIESVAEGENEGGEEGPRDSTKTEGSSQSSKEGESGKECGSGSRSASHGLNPCSSEDEEAYVEHPVPDTIRVLFHPTYAHGDIMLDSAWTAEVVEQVLALASNETAKVHVQRRTTAAHLVAAASGRHSPQDHGTGTRRAMTTFVQSTQPQDANAGPTLQPDGDSDDCYQQQERQHLPPTPPARLQRFVGCSGSGDVYASRPRTFTLPAQRSISDAAALTESTLTDFQMDDLRSMLDSTSWQTQQPEQKQNHSVPNMVRRRTTKLE
ncbi:hypothetical protein DUNSADRAFT_16396 [Dunaliella salina]|uniref:AB hydrolase-1 domain-containing protein n=1 Tax=Dunaliella salina TaxID=3046 RepID=A0ABQ7G3P3_DUNSA|nr:hypothetical protein DUNSADRAFT_16396 [Dunaliella salina]|eukprot:KAF5829221.1 hypothetical protein DUNSADRAFT_16396 [Dunaliella salina]